MKKIFITLLTFALIGILLIGVSESPKFGEESNPVNNYVSKGYLENTIKETGAVNIVAGIILDYRAFDTFIETTVLFCGSAVVIMCLKRKEKE